METSADRHSDVISAEPEQSADPGSDLLLGSASSLVSPETGAASSPTPPADLPRIPSEVVVTTETNSSPPPAAGPTPSCPGADTWVTSQLLAPPSATCQSQLIIVEPRGQTLQERMVIVTGQSEGRGVLVIPSNQLSGSQLAVISSSPAGAVVNIPVTTVTDSSSSGPIGEQIAADVSACVTPPPSSAPSWALRLRNIQKLGDSYRGFCCSEAELEAILLLHKQQTGSVFGTRQSPSVDKPATRLMWKSQYVPYDGIPFVNAGSRAVVMECQFGPRRKGLQANRSSDSAEGSYKATCPARIYIKKVRKFPEFRVPTEPTADRRTVRQEQEKAFQCLKNQNLETGGVIRFYLQLPTERAHLYHSVDTPTIPPPPPDLPPPPPTLQQEDEDEEETDERDGHIPSRLHPRVAERIRQLVAAGHHQVYSVRKQLRRFVEKELFKCDGLPERHNLRFFPTVNDIKNHIHESQKALGLSLSHAAEWTEENSDPLMETVTLTLTPAAEGNVFYLQLPTERAHLYHSVDTPTIPPPPPDLPPPPPTLQQEDEDEEETDERDGHIPSRLHPRVAERIRQLVAAGHHQVYSVRKQLRRFVEKELFKCDGLPERHNLRFFPTVNDIKNHIHESQKALGLSLSHAAEWTEENSDPLMETVTLTLTPAAEGVDGSDSLSPEAVQLFSSLSSLQPKIFAQLQGILQPLPPPPPPPLSPLPPSSFLQTLAGGSAGVSCPEEELDDGQQLSGGTQQTVILQNEENIELQIISATDNTGDASRLQVEVKKEEEEEEMKMEEFQDSAGSC